MNFDAEKLDMIIFNLLSNAFKFTPSGGTISFTIQANNSAICTEDTKTFRIGELDTKDYAGISIQDNGPGINESDLERIFERFFQSPKHAETGTGIGLALAAELTLVHGGEITVCSSPGSGSLFVLKLPVEQPNPAEQTDGDNYSPAMTTQVSGPENEQQQGPDEGLIHQELYGAVIVVVEDHPDLLVYISELLKSYFTVIGATDGSKGLEAIGNLLPDLVISDVLMPGMDGIELCKTIKTGISTSHIPVILLTALSGTDDQLKGLKVGADDYIPKPFHEEILLAKVNNLLLNGKRLKESFLTDHSSWNKSIARFDIDRELIAKATRVVENNLQNPDFGVDLLASELAISRSNLHRKLKSLTDQSGTEFIRYVKVQCAIRLMKEGKKTVNEIGFMAGFNSHTYFTKSFKQFTGYSPSDFIRIVKNK
jgi:DNA-binding response OmpR family regulator